MDAKRLPREKNAAFPPHSEDFIPAAGGAFFFVRQKIKRAMNLVPDVAQRPFFPEIGLGFNAHNARLQAALCDCLALGIVSSTCGPEHALLLLLLRPSAPGLGAISACLRMLQQP